MGPGLSPRAADLDAVPRVEPRPRHHPDARVLRAGARQPRQPRDDRRRHPRRTRAACCTRWAAPSGGLTAYLDDGYLCYEYNLFIIMRTKIRSEERLPAGPAKIEISTEYAEVKPGGPLNITLSVNGDRAARPARCRSARRCCSPPTTASTSAYATAAASHWTTTTARRSRSTARSRTSTSATRLDGPQAMRLKHRCRADITTKGQRWDS